MKRTCNQSNLHDFLQTMKEVLNKKISLKEYDKIEKNAKKLRGKIDQLLEMKLEGIISKEDYTIKYSALHDELSQKERIMQNYQEQNEKEAEVNERIRQFKEAIEQNPELTIFSREIFERMIDKVIIGGKGIDANPYQITFLYFNGIADVIDGRVLIEKIRTKITTDGKISGEADSGRSDADNDLSAKGDDNDRPDDLYTRQKKGSINFYQRELSTNENIIRPSKIWL